MQSRFLSIALLLVMMFMLSTTFAPVAYADDPPATGDSSTNGIPDVSVSGGQMVITGAGFGAEDSDDAWTDFLGKYSKVIGGVSGTVAITLFIALVVQIGRLGVNSTTPQGRSGALSAILWTLIATAILGAVGVFFSFFYKAIG